MRAITNVLFCGKCGNYLVDKYGKQIWYGDTTTD